MRVVWFQLLLHYLVTSEFKWRPVMLCSAINACHVRFSETRYALFGSRGAYRDLSERCCCLQVVCFPRDDRAVFEKKEKRQKENENKEKTPTFAITKRGRDKRTLCMMKDLLTSRKVPGREHETIKVPRASPSSTPFSVERGKTLVM